AVRCGASQRSHLREPSNHFLGHGLALEKESTESFDDRHRESAHKDSKETAEGPETVFPYPRRDTPFTPVGCSGRLARLRGACRASTQGKLHRASDRRVEVFCTNSVPRTCADQMFAQFHLRTRHH